MSWSKFRFISKLVNPRIQCCVHVQCFWIRIRQELGTWSWGSPRARLRVGFSFPTSPAKDKRLVEEERVFGKELVGGHSCVGQFPFSELFSVHRLQLAQGVVECKLDRRLSQTGHADIVRVEDAALEVESSKVEILCTRRKKLRLPAVNFRTIATFQVAKVGAVCRHHHLKKKKKENKEKQTLKTNSCDLRKSVRKICYLKHSSCLFTLYKICLLKRPKPKKNGENLTSGVHNCVSPLSWLVSERDIVWTWANM